MATLSQEITQVTRARLTPGEGAVLYLKNVGTQPFVYTPVRGGSGTTVEPGSDVSLTGRNYYVTSPAAGTGPGNDGENGTLLLIERRTA